MRVLLHACCAPCTIKFAEALRAERIKPDMFWYNPNIHPYTEYKNRKESLGRFAKESNLRLIEEDFYGLREFIGKTASAGSRCKTCYSMRLDETAKHAARNGYDAFATTLLISPHQKHDALIYLGEKAAAANKVKFLYRDYRDKFYEGQKQAREAGYYMQKYCGCIFSEEERYLGLEKPTD